MAESNENITEMSRDELGVCVAYRSVCDILCDMRKCMTKSESKQKSEIKQATKMAKCN